MTDDCISRYIIGIAGPPGGGKSTLAALVRDTVNNLAADEASDAGDSPAVMVPMDGDYGPIGYSALSIRGVTSTVFCAVIDDDDQDGDIDDGGSGGGDEDVNLT